MKLAVYTYFVNSTGQLWETGLPAKASDLTTHPERYAALIASSYSGDFSTRNNPKSLSG